MAAAKKKPEAGKRLDLTFLSFVLILLTTGLVMLFSASYAYSYEYYGNSYKFITRQAAFAAAGVALMLIISKILLILEIREDCFTARCLHLYKPAHG